MSKPHSYGTGIVVGLFIGIFSTLLLIGIGTSVDIRRAPPTSTPPPTATKYLGHDPPGPTVSAYLTTEAGAESRRLDTLLEKIRKELIVAKISARMSIEDLDEAFYSIAGSYDDPWRIPIIEAMNRLEDIEARIANVELLLLSVK